MSNIDRSSVPVIGRAAAWSLAVVTAVIILAPSGLMGADADADSTAAPIPRSTIAPAGALCDSLADLHLIIAFLEETDVEEEGWLPMFVGVVAGLSEAGQLAGAVGDTYRPLVEDVIIELETLGETIRDVREAGTVGSKVAAVGEAITGVGNAMDALSMQLRIPCPTTAPPAG